MRILLNAEKTEEISRMLENAEPNIAIRLPVKTQNGNPVLAMKFRWTGALNLPHTGYLVEALFRTRTALREKNLTLPPVGIEDHGIVLELDQRALLHARHNETLLCALGGDEAEDLLQAIALAESNWEKAATRLDRDGY